MTNKTYQFNIGVDIAKHKVDVSFSDQRVVSFENNQSGFKLLLKEIENKSQTRVVMEATGGYEKPLAHFLQDHGVAVSIVNANRVREGADSIECKLYVTVGTILINLIPKLLPSSF